MKKMIKLFCATFAVSVFAFQSIAMAAYPFDRSINIIIPFGPGGSVDISTRIIADYLLQKHDININVVNKPGGSQAIGMSEILRARPDGYTMVFPTFSALATTPKISNVGFTSKDFKPVAQIMALESVYAVGKDSPIKSFHDVIETIKTNPDTVYATTGAISAQRLYTTQLLNEFFDSLKVRHIAYTSNHEVGTALLGNHVTFGVSVPTNVVPYVESGDLRPLAIARATRHPSLPDTPTMRELFADKVDPESEKWIDFGMWGGLLVSKRVPDSVIETFLPYIEEALADPGVKEKLQNIGIEPMFLPPAEFQEVIDNSSNLVDNLLQGRKSLD